MPGLNGVPPARDLHLGRCRTLRGRLRAMRSATTPPRPLRPALYRRRTGSPPLPPVGSVSGCELSAIRPPLTRRFRRCRGRMVGYGRSRVVETVVPSRSKHARSAFGQAALCAALRRCRTISVDEHRPEDLGRENRVPRRRRSGGRLVERDNHGRVRPRGSCIVRDSSEC